MGIQIYNEFIDKRRRIEEKLKQSEDDDRINLPERRKIGRKKRKFVIHCFMYQSELEP